MEAEATDPHDLQPPEPAALIKPGTVHPFALTPAWLDRSQPRTQVVPRFGAYR